MSSWFNLSDTIDKLKDTVQENFNIKQETLEKLTLTTPELLEERKRLDEEEKRKERVRDALSGMLPWETNDEEREILVEECKDAILALSSDESTFTGPYQMPESGVVVDEGNDDDDKKDDGGADADDEDGKKKTAGPSEESLSKLSMLEPLPPLLADFDIDTHVGLIQRVLEVDPQLVEMQSDMSGGGEREKVFWRNYFFHCAYTRYEAGLSIDEIWSDQQQATTKSSTGSSPSNDAVAESGGSDSVAEAGSSEHDETITFEDVGGQQQKTEPSTTTGAAAAATTTTSINNTATTEDNTASQPTAATGSALFDAVASAAADNETTAQGAASSVGDSSPVSNVGSEYEMIGESGDPELDALEAEIAAELED